MTVGQAREAAREWMAEEASRIPGFRGAYTAGSTNWLPDDADLPAGSDLDIMVLLADGSHAGGRRKFIYRGALLEVSCLRSDQLELPEQILGDYHLAPSFRTAKIIFDPSGRLTPLLAAVSRGYAKPRWVRRRCANADDKVLRNLQSIDKQTPLHDQVMACLFAAGVTTHVLLAAGLRNPTVRARYMAVRDLLGGYGHLEFHETLLHLLGSAHISRGRVERHVATLAEAFDAARGAIRTPFPFASDISDSARPAAIDSSQELIGRGYYREAMFWIGVTYSRCRKILSADAAGEMFDDAYQELAGDLGLTTPAEVRLRSAEIRRTLPRIRELAESIIARNSEIDND